MPQRLQQLFVFLAALAAASACAEAAYGQLRIGIVLPLSGRAASLGDAIENGALLALNNLPESSRSKITVQFQDDQSESLHSVNAFRKLSESGIDVVITALSNAGNAVVPFSERSATVHLSLAFDRAISSGKRFTFSFWPDIADFAQAAAEELLRRGQQRIALVVTQHEGNIAMRKSLLEALKPGQALLLTEEVLPAETDFRTPVLRLKKQPQVQTIAGLLHPGHLGLFVRTVREQGIALPVFTLGNFEDAGVRRAGGAALTGQWYAAAAYTPAFLIAYRSHYPDSSIYGAAFAHDAVILLAKAAEQGVKPAGLPHFLRTAAPFSGAAESVSPDGRNGFKFPVVIKTVGTDGL